MAQNGRVATWQDVEEIALPLDGARPGLSPDGGPTFAVKASIWARLDLLDRTELDELLTKSWRARRGVRR